MTEQIPKLNRFQILWLERHYIARKYREKVLMKIAWRLPKELVKWCYLRVAAHATGGKFSGTIVPELTMMDALKRWDEK